MFFTVVQLNKNQVVTSLVVSLYLLRIIANEVNRTVVLGVMKSAEGALSLEITVTLGGRMIVLFLFSTFFVQNLKSERT